jgi:hypothetical protein
VEQPTITYASLLFMLFTEVVRLSCLSVALATHTPLFVYLDLLPGFGRHTYLLRLCALSLQGTNAGSDGVVSYLWTFQDYQKKGSSNGAVTGAQLRITIAAQ